MDPFQFPAWAGILGMSPTQRKFASQAPVSASPGPSSPPSGVVACEAPDTPKRKPGRPPGVKNRQK